MLLWVHETEGVTSPLGPQERKQQTEEKEVIIMKKRKVSKREKKKVKIGGEREKKVQ